MIILNSIIHYTYNGNTITITKCELHSFARLIVESNIRISIVSNNLEENETAQSHVCRSISMQVYIEME